MLDSDSYLVQAEVAEAAVGEADWACAEVASSVAAGAAAGVLAEAEGLATEGAVGAASEVVVAVVEADTEQWSSHANLVESATCL